MLIYYVDFARVENQLCLRESYKAYLLFLIKIKTPLLVFDK
jgi:hypothetical protein